MRQHRLRLAMLGLLLLTACQQPDAGPPAEHADLTSADFLIENARIYTSNEQQPWAQALAVKDGRFAYVGDEAGLSRFTATKRYDLQGQLLIPGLIDGHAHPGYVSVEDFGEVSGDTPEALLTSVKH